MIKVIIKGAVHPANTIDEAAAHVARARQDGITDVRIKVVPNFPSSVSERDLTPDEFDAIVHGAANILGGKS